MQRFTDKVVVVTGGGSGIGLASAGLFAREGAKVIIIGRNEAALRIASESLDGDVEAVSGDVSRLRDLDSLGAYIGRKHGGVDILFANAGGGALGPVEGVTEADFDRTVATNFKGTYFTVQKLIPLLRNGSSVILNTSIAGSKGLPNFSVYSATKAAVRSLARTWTTDLRGRGIRVNAIAPGHIDTDIMVRNGIPAEQVAGINDEVTRQIPMNRMGTPDEIASAVAFLASDDASYITGIELTVDGGWIQV
ncbi:SDR family oxidoreductase [Rhizobium sp. BE258]|uniref:SDR family oxidoreductase n=1 Tax=Rhizobium sp. BE258 TaxID=2817722 RepID=UPI000DD968FC|nr:SDR family oxidoreductase [Rhizobium sp. BE258]MDR7144989.1 NAD(P)-dependent dehydrogenase (short-subunit alcohol dehydrogenase family) [Rhizobium sp. BE258]